MLFEANPEGARLAGRSNHEDAKAASVCLGRAAARRAKLVYQPPHRLPDGLRLLSPAITRPIARSNSEDEIAAISHVFAVVASMPAGSLLHCQPACSFCRRLLAARATTTPWLPLVSARPIHLSHLKPATHRIGACQSPRPTVCSVQDFFKECHFSLSSHTQSSVSRRSVSGRGTRSPPQVYSIPEHTNTATTDAASQTRPRRRRRCRRCSHDAPCPQCFNAPARSLRHGS